MRRTAIGRTAVVVAGLVALAGCDGSSGDPSPATTSEDDAAGGAAAVAAADTSDQEAATDAATEAPEEAATGDTDEAATTSPDDGAALLAEAIAATDDATTSRSRQREVSTTPEGELVVVVEAEHDGPDARMTMEFSGSRVSVDAETDVEVVLLDGKTYERRPTFTAALGLDREWLVFDIERLGDDRGAYLERALAMAPASALGPVRRGGEVEVVGTEDIDGIATTRLRVSVPIAAALELDGADPADLAARGIDPDEIVDIDLWIDDQSRLRREQLDVQLGDEQLMILHEVLAYDVDVTIEAPPSEDVADEDIVREAVLG